MNERKLIHDLLPLDDDETADYEFLVQVDEQNNNNITSELKKRITNIKSFKEQRQFNVNFQK